MGAAILFTSLQLRLAEPYHVVQCKLPTYTMWYGRCHLVSCGPGYVWLVEPYYVVPLESSATPKHGIWVHVASFVLHNTVANMLCRLFDDRKYMDIYLPIPKEYCYRGKQNKIVFSRMKLWTLVTFTFTARKLFKLTIRRHLYWVCANILRSFF